MVAHAVIPAHWEAKVGGSPEVRSSRPAWPTWRKLVSTKNTKISQAWWRTPVFPATWEAETGELLEPRRQRLWWAEIAPWTPAWVTRAKLHLKKKKKKKILFLSQISLLMKHNIWMFHFLGWYLSYFPIWIFLSFYLFIYLKMGFLHVGQAGLELPTSGDPPTLDSQIAGLQVWATAPCQGWHFNLIFYNILVSSTYKIAVQCVTLLKALFLNMF